MDINELTLGQIKDLRNIFPSDRSNSESNLYARYVGLYVICRSRNEGVNAGEVIALDETGVILKNARRLYYHKPINKNVSWYEGVAKFGLSFDSRVGEPAEKLITEDYSLTVCTDVARDSIIEIKSNEQS